ncbi:hypothetical protein ISF_08203 [Cordyceps fumosorosea ARSEF 2679]|uniref:Uncharacterized protein n=1 Tax=Cordyceps fumosorosea (strain ARSEF 2679) TaxID=1081104 RepID=A0A167MZ42_CORFA|nr:hypothetical protein ISF_08203 [Cordyceps fumosorosea ARSEF 2679]OAA54932.1 hypothetical protein ISF_08203 [Cordyceps fumosorosea ARSEF 2679]
MKRVLLTSSQVSIILTGIVIFLCTLALFLSGYVIQQRTVNDLREAIRPRPRPVTKPHLPARFKSRITELDDGSIVFYESEADEEARQERQHIEIRETKPEPGPEPEEVRARQEEEMSRATQKQRQMLRDIQSKVAQQSWAVENPDPWAKSKVPVDAVERRQMIRDELKRLSTSDGPVPWSKRIWY